MSNIFSKYEKELAGIKVIDSSNAYVYNPKTKRRDLPNPKFDFVGKIDSSMPNFVLKMNKSKCKTGYIEDVSCLPKRLKSDIIRYIINSCFKILQIVLFFFEQLRIV